MYDVYYLPRQPPPSAGILLGLCDLVPPSVVLFVLCWGGISILRRLILVVWWFLRQFWRVPEYITTSPFVSVPPTVAPTPSPYLPIHPSPPQLTEFARMVAPYLADNQLTALHQPSRLPLMSTTPAYPTSTPCTNCPTCPVQNTPSSPQAPPTSPRNSSSSSRRRTRSSANRE